MWRPVFGLCGGWWAYRDDLPLCRSGCDPETGDTAVVGGADGLAGDIGGGADRDDAVRGGGVESFPVGGDRDVVSCDGDGLAGRAGGGADRDDVVRGGGVEGLSVGGDRDVVSCDGDGL